MTNSAKQKNMLDLSLLWTFWGAFVAFFCYYYYHYSFTFKLDCNKIKPPKVKTPESKYTKSNFNRVTLKSKIRK